MIITNDYSDAAYAEVANGLALVSNELHHLGRTESGHLAYDLYAALMAALSDTE